MTWPYYLLICVLAGLAGGAVYRYSDLFPRGREWWDGLPDAPPPDEAAVADMQRAIEAGEAARTKREADR